jgi:hypothetical protein
MNLGKLDIDLDAVLAEAMQSMDSENDLRWSVGYALEILYRERVEQLQLRMVEQFNTNKESAT